MPRPVSGEASERITLMRTARSCLAVTREMARRKLSPPDILGKLRLIDALMADGRSIADALWGAGVLPAEYEKWRNEYAGLLRTLGPLATATPKVIKKSRRGGLGRPLRTVK